MPSAIHSLDDGASSLMEATEPSYTRLPVHQLLGARGPFLIHGRIPAPGVTHRRASGRARMPEGCRLPRGKVLHPYFKLSLKHPGVFSNTRPKNKTKQKKNQKIPLVIKLLPLIRVVNWKLRVQNKKKVVRRPKPRDCDGCLKLFESLHFLFH